VKVHRAELRVVVPGVAIVGVAFGMARYGYGLLLPDMREALHLSSGVLGLIATGSYVSYLAATALAGAVSARAGARLMVLVAGLLGAAGMLVIAAAQGPGVLAAGVLVAGAAAGLAFPPFSDVVVAELSPGRRPRAFAWISSGTGAGVAIAAPVAILAGSSWRLAWVGFAVLAVVVGVVGSAVLPRSRLAPSTEAAAPLRWRWFVCPRSGPLLLGSLLIGLTASVWWTFAVDLVASEGGLSTTQSRLLQGLVGIASLLGALGGDLVRRFGAPVTYTALTCLYAGSLLGLACDPSNPLAAFPAGLAFGASYNLVVTIEGLWSAQVFVDRPSTGLAAVMSMSGLGLLAGPVLAGPLADVTSLRVVFAVAAGLALLLLFLRPRGHSGPPRSRGDASQRRAPHQPGDALAPDLPGQSQTELGVDPGVPRIAVT